MVHPALGGMAGHSLGLHLHPIRSSRSAPQARRIRLLIIVVNVGIVLYMAMLRMEAAKKRHAAQAHP